jgi:hypothetical protein
MTVIRGCDAGEDVGAAAAEQFVTLTLVRDTALAV